MAIYGLTTTGFVTKTLAVIVDELKASFRTAFGESIDLSDASIEGQIIGIVAEREALLWELAEAVYNAQNPDAATGQALDALCLLTGTFRDPASKSVVTLTLTGTDATSVTAGSRVSTLSTGVDFETLDTVTLALITAWAGTTVYTVGQRRSNASRCYQCITAGTSAGAGGPTTTAADITDGTVHWRYLGEGLALVDAEAVATATGPLVATSGDITVIETPLAGWSSVINVLDATLGSNQTTDEGLRLLREAELGAQGSGPVPALRAEMLRVDAVEAVTVFQNVTDVTDADGIPPHAVEVMVQGGVDADIREALFNGVGAGIKTHGTVSGTHTDSQGTLHTIKFTRPTEIPIWIIITLVVDANKYPLDGNDQVEAAIVEWGDAQAAGKNAVSAAISAQAFNVDGVLDVTSCLIGTANPPVASTTVAISLRQLATYDTSRITVITSNGTP